MNCNRCFNSTISVDGVSCFYCESYETIEAFLLEIHQPVPKPDNESTECNFPSADEQFDTVGASYTLLNQRSISTKDIEINEVNQCHSKEIFERSNCLPVDRICNIFDKECITYWNFLKTNPNRKDGKNINNHSLKPVTKRHSMEILNKSNNDPMIRDPNVEACKIKSSLPEDSFYAVAGPVRLQREKEISKLYDEILLPKKSSTVEPGAYTCKFCNMDISHHVRDMNKVYKCCSCPYETSLQRNLQRHSYSHLPKKICSICEKEYVCELHKKKRICVVCNSVFMCRTQLNEHHLFHHDFENHCWVCCELIETHFIERDNRTIYTCCVCDFQGQKRDLIVHNRVHCPKVFCKICKEDYDAKGKTLHLKEKTCFGCKESFPCKSQLEDHLFANEECRYSHCSICEKEIDEHRCTLENKRVFKCCQCINKVAKSTFHLALHLFIHSGLRIFKCDKCRKRFQQKQHLKTHSMKCSNLRFKCEICGVPFSSIDSLDVHCLVKHY